MVRFALALAVAFLLSGCAGSTGGNSDMAEDAPTGTLRGVVVDSAIRPLAGAVVTIAAQSEARHALSGADGLFAFEGLDLGVVVLEVTKPGYLSAHVQAQVRMGEPEEVVRVLLEPSLETRPFIVQESFSGFLDCGVGSATLFGFTFACQQTAGAGLAVLCEGGGPVPPLGVCVPETEPYFHSQTTGNITMAQSELIWEPSSAGASDLLLLDQVFDADGQIVTGAAYVAGPSFLVLRLNSTVIREHQLGGPNHLGFYVSVGPTQPANVVVQQSYRLFHTTAYHFEFEAEWTFVEDGTPLVPPTCTTCLAP
jgi:hypothetical protein